ncbi:MAG TPA: lipid-A-disaccharide synthase [Bacteroidia bacterium]|nr:lipid-A-disaccharide synthase [Bacteroidia bacterium]
MKYYLISGEASGDLHASNLVRELKQLDPAAEFRGFGGDLLAKEGMHLVRHYRDLAFMGFAEVILHLRTILNNISFCKNDIREWKPDAVILVDYPGFNLRVAPFVKELGIKVFYYISPQVWAWKQSRVFRIREVVDRMFCILPFEKDFYAKFDFEVDFVGHPLLDAIAREENSEPALADDGRKIIALLPGSRGQEIKTMLPVMLSAASRFPEFRFVIAGAPSQPEKFYRGLMNGNSTEIVFGKTYALLRQSHAAIVTSGTATLETALHAVPEVVCYRGSTVSYQIAKRLVKVDYISLVNLVMGKEVVKELIQSEMNAGTISAELKKITADTNSRQKMLDDYAVLREKLGGPGASRRTAELIIKNLGA